MNDTNLPGNAGPAAAMPHYSFFNHKECEFFPCHETTDPDHFNCLFCYCPLYALGRKCGGNFRYNGGIKDCSGCMLPHRRENYFYIINHFQQIVELIQEHEGGEEA